MGYSWFIIFIVALEKMIIKSKCNSCGKKNRYEKEEWKGRENTLCLSCGMLLTICSGYIYDLMDEKEYENFIKICGG